MKHIFTAAVLAAQLCACSSIIEGTTQEISVNTNPAGATCSLTRKGDVIARLESTPAAVKIDKTKDDITVVCDKDGFTEATYLNHSGAAGATVGNILLGGGIGWAVDSADGADNKYESSVNITLERNMAALQAPPYPSVAKTPQDVTPQPVTQEVTPQPVTQEVTPQPVTQEVTPQPVTQEVTPQPVTQEVTPQPVTQEVTSQPMTQEVTPQPVTSAAENRGL